MLLSPTNCDDEIANYLHSLDEEDENEIVNLLNDNFNIEEDDWNQNDLSGLNLSEVLEIGAKSPLLLINGVNCAAHTMQLSVKGALAMLEVEHSNVIKLCREVAKFLRTENTRIEARNRNLKLILPSLDVETRWSSTYLLVSKHV